MQGATNGTVESIKGISATIGTKDVSENITSANGAAVETGKSAGGVLEAAKDLSTQDEILRKEIDRFVDDDAA